MSVVFAVPSAKSARILIAIALPGQALFAFIADYIHNGMKSLITPEFMAAYLVVVLLQVSPSPTIISAMDDTV